MSTTTVTPWWLERDTLRRVWTGIRLSPSNFVTDHEPDPELRALAAEPFDSVAAVGDRLGSLENALVDRGDRRSIFLTVYTEMTTHTARALSDGAFGDPEWMRQYLIMFAEYYRRAFLAFETRRFNDVPDPWLVAFGTAVRGEALVVQDAFLGINAHIVYDLALTLSDIGLDPDRARKYADHCHIDGILARLVAIQRELLAERYAPGLSRVGDAMAGLDERWSAATLRSVRETAWRTAVIRFDSRWQAAVPATEWLLARMATGGGALLLQPSASPATLQALHAVEADRFDLSQYTQSFHERAARELDSVS